MRFRALSIAAAGLALTVPALGAAAQDGPQASGKNRVEIELDCEGTPEITKITNKGNDELEVRKLTSLVDPLNREPFKINETLEKGQTLRLESGEDASNRDELTDDEIYDDEDDREGVKIRTSEGSFTEKCDD